MNLTKYLTKKNLILAVLWIIAIVTLSLVSVYRNNNPVMITLIVFGLVAVLAIAIMSGLSKVKKTDTKSLMVEKNINTLNNFAEKNKDFEYDSESYTKKMLYKGLNILETIDNQTFIPISGRKRGKKFFNIEQVLIYLKRIKMDKK